MIKHIGLAALAVAAFIAFADARPSVSATASLKDGSTVKGEFLTDTVKGSTLFAKDLARTFHSTDYELHRHER